jgi:hypothetical protein
VGIKLMSQNTSAMANNNKTLTTAMEGGGFYNRNSMLQAAGIALALPFLEKAALSFPIDTKRSDFNSAAQLANRPTTASKR